MASTHIKILEDIVIRQIAAGEVIERPASALRELIDNSIDANAKKIDIYCNNGGLDLLSIDDDGDGILKDDLPLCCISHATSKITTSSDLFTIHSMGFRGEALASLSSIARVTITSSTDNKEAYEITVNEEKQSEVHPASRTKGTGIQVENMFYSVPARKKFLSSANVEEQLIKNTLLKKAASFPTIAFSLNSSINNTKKIPLYLPVEDAFSRSIRICSKNNIENFLWQDTVYDNDISLSCALGKPDIAQKTRKNIHIYVNNRPIKDFTITQAIEFSYRNVIHGGVFPQAVLFLTIPPNKIDVNIHPTKSEIKLLEIDRIRKLIISTLDKKLQSFSSTSPSIETKHFNSIFDTQNQTNKKNNTFSSITQTPAYNKPDNPMTQDTTKHPYTLKNYTTDIPHKPNNAQSSIPSHQKETYNSFHTKSNNNFLASQKENYTTPHTTHKEANIKSLETIRSTNKIIRDNFSYIGTIFDTYLIFEKEETLYFLDFHAVHERLIFDNLTQETKKMDLLIPIPLEISRSKANNTQLIEEYKAYNILLEEKNETLHLQAIPSNCPISADNVAKIIEETINATTKSQSITASIFARKACRYAVKARGIVDFEAAFELLFFALKLKEPRCPHGRPLWINMDKKHLDSLIGRT